MTVKAWLQSAQNTSLQNLQNICTRSDLRIWQFLCYMRKTWKVDERSVEVLNWRHTQVTAAHTKSEIVPISIERWSKEDIRLVFHQRSSLTANTWSCNLICLLTFLQRTQKPAESDQTLPSWLHNSHNAEGRGWHMRLRVIQEQRVQSLVVSNKSYFEHDLVMVV